MRRLIKAAEDAAAAARRQHAAELIVIVTATLRQARNTALIRRRLRGATGWEPHVIAGEDEARTSPCWPG